MEHLYPLFIHEDTLEILNFQEWINNNGWHSYGAVPYDSQAITDVLVKTNPPNEALSVYPELAKWNRLYRDNEPSVHLWQKFVLDEPYQNSAGYWVQHYSVVAKDSSEMISVNFVVAEHAKFMRNIVQSSPINLEGAYSTASNEDVAALSGCLHGMTANVNETDLSWKGPPDSVGLPQWFTMEEMDVVENLYSIVFRVQQNAFRAERYVTEKQRITPYDTINDVTVDFMNKFNELEGTQS